VFFSHNKSASASTAFIASRTGPIFAKRRDVSDPTCLFCNEKESINHLFFDYCVSSNVWKIVSGFLCLELGYDFESIGQFWIANKRHKLTNIISSAVLWFVWKLRNETCFQGAVWLGMRSILLKIVRMLRRWMVLFGQDVG
jgi:hypothetical protein